MTLNRYAARTDRNQSEIVKALRNAGYVVWIIGWPVDLLVRTNKQWLPMEVKTEKGKPKPVQEEFIANAGNCPAAVVRDAESAIRACRSVE